MAISKKLLVIFLFTSLFANAQRVTIKPKPNWVNDQNPELNVSPSEEVAGGFYYLLVDNQENVSLQERYGHYAYKILTTDGIQEMSDVTLTYDPTYEKLTIHQLTVHRGGKTIDQLNIATINTIQREESMERNLYDGSLTVSIHFNDIRVGDVIEYAYTYKGSNPVFKGHYSRRINLTYTLPYHKLITRILIPSNKRIEIKLQNGADEPIKTQLGSVTEYLWVKTEGDAVLYHSNVPSWYDPSQYIRITDYNSWSDVVQWASEHFKVDQAQIEKLNKRLPEFEKEEIKTNEDLTLSIIRFVQDDIRYLGFESGLNGYKPHDPVDVYDQRFGDCKDKSLLLVTLLGLYDVKAYPMLVNTTIRGQMSNLLPASTVFDHCVVTIETSNGTFYVDPTISNQGGDLSSNYFPSYGYGLVIKDGEEELRKLPEPLQPSTVENQTYTLHEVDGDAALTIETTYEGSDADTQRSYFASSSREAIQKNYVNYLSNLYSDITPLGVIEYSDDRKKNAIIVTEKYQINKFWTEDESVPGQVNAEFYSLPLESYVNISKETKRTAPYYLSYPVSYKHIINVSLPDEWNINEEQKEIYGDGYQYTYKVSFNNRSLSIERHYQTNKEHIDPVSILKFVQDHESMHNTLAYALSIDKAYASGFKFSWISLFIGFIIFGVALYGCYHLYYRYDPKLPGNYTHGQPIGGWLVLVGIGLFLSPIRLLYDFATTEEYFNSTLWAALVNQKKWSSFLLMAFEFAYNISYCVFGLLVLSLFLKRRTSLPRMICFYYGITCVITLLDTLAAHTLNPTAVDWSYSDVGRTMVVAAIWIPYFQLSERVKSTFVERVNDNNDPEPDPEKTLTYSMRG